MVWIAVLLVALAGCNVSPFDLNHQGGGDDTRDGGGDDDDGGTGIDADVCVATGLDNTCNELDDDCSGTVDDPFDKTMDPANCGTCGNRCMSPNAVVTCEGGACELQGCLPGFVDLDGAAGCEYLCPVFPPGVEDCNGVDEDCDGLIDEPADLPPPPTGLCRGTAGTPCAGTAMICATRGAVTTWYCDYDPAVEFDPSIPNGILLHEQACDGADGDCDGVADDEFTDLGQICDNGADGVCRDLGVRTCDPADETQTTCDLGVLPDAGTMTTESCNGLDDDCNGGIDEDPGIDATMPVVVAGTTISVDVFEASHPDATASVIGVATNRACSNPGVLPWRGATFAVATAACAAAGKRLCTAAEWRRACEGGSPATTFPYGDGFDDDACNAEAFDGVPGGADDDVLLATGARPMCVADDGLFDLSGNLKEWTDEITGETGGGVDIAVLRGGAYDTPDLGATCAFRSSRAAVDTVLPTIGFRCCKTGLP